MSAGRGAHAAVGMAPGQRATSRSVSRNVLPPVLETPPSTPTAKASLAKDELVVSSSSGAERNARSQGKRRSLSSAWCDGGLSKVPPMPGSSPCPTVGEISEGCEISPSDSDDQKSAESFATARSVASSASTVRVRPRSKSMHVQSESVSIGVDRDHMRRLSTPCKPVVTANGWARHYSIREVSRPCEASASDSDEQSGAESTATTLSIATNRSRAESQGAMQQTALQLAPRGEGPLDRRKSCGGVGGGGAQSGRVGTSSSCALELGPQVSPATPSKPKACESALPSPRPCPESLPPRAASAPPRQCESLRSGTAHLNSPRRSPQQSSKLRRHSHKLGIRASVACKENVRPALDGSLTERSSSSTAGPGAGQHAGRTCRSGSESARERRSHQDCSLLPCNRASSSAARHLATARGPAARDAFRCALLQGVHRPRCAKLGFVGAARAGKTSTLRALAGLPLRADEESTPGLAMWEISQELLATSPKRRWQLQEARAAADSARWDSGVAQYVADCVRPTGGGRSSACGGGNPGGASLDASVLKRMPVDLIARRLGEPPKSAEEDDAMVLETYDFGGQEVYYAMHHLFLTDFGIYLACVDLSTFRSQPAAAAKGDLTEDTCTSAGEHSWEALEWWLASISINAPNSPVAIVGTHDDCLDPKARAAVHRAVHDRIVALCTRVPELNAKLWVNEEEQLCFFPIDNSGADGGASASALRGAVSAMAGELLAGPLGQPVPLRWAHFWAVLQRTPQDRTGPLCRVDQLWHRCSRYGFEGLAELQRFLQHFRGLGALLHFPEAPSEELRGLVCLDPAWVADAAASVLVAKDRVVQGCTKYSAELRDRGLLHSELLAALWRPRAFVRHQQQLLGMLQVFDLLVPWGHDRQGPASYQSTEVQQVFLVPSLLPPRPLRPPGEVRSEMPEEDSIAVYLDFHGLLHRLLPTLFPRVLCALSRMEVAAQILSVYSNYALFAVSTQGQAEGDSARSLGGRRQVQKKLLISLQPCGGGELIRCCLRPRRGAGGGDGGVPTRPSWRHVEKLLHAFRDAVAAWMPRLSFKAGIRCPACCQGRAHPVDLHTALQEELPLCPRSGEPLEDLPSWLADWRGHLLAHSPPPAARQRSATCDVGEAQPLGCDSGLHLEYLYASPLDVAPLDVRAEMEILAGLAGVGSLKVRTATTETLVEVWHARARSCRSPSHGAAGPSSSLQVLCLSAHCAVDPHKPKVPPALMLEDAAGRSHALSEEDLGELLGSFHGEGAHPFDVVVLNACHSEQMANCFIRAGARCAVACAGTVFDAAARAFLRSFLSALAVEGLGHAAEAFASAKRTVRLSPQPGLRAEAERFRFLEAAATAAEPAPPPPPPPPQPPPLPAPVPRPGPQWRGGACSLPSPVEDFVGRAPALMVVAQAFLSVRRVVWLHGRAGLGKSALAAEFCRFYALSGDRLFSPSPDVAACGKSAGGAEIVRLGGLEPGAALRRVEEVLGSSEELRSADTARGRRWLLVLDGIDALTADVINNDQEDAAGALWRRLEEALTTTEHLRLLLTSRRPRYDAPLTYKVVAYEVPALAPEDAALLLARRAHRPLYPGDFDASAADGPGSGGAASDPLILAGRRREFLQQLAGHPLLAAVGGIPAAVLAAAAEVTPQLPSLFSHSMLLARSDAGPAGGA